MRKIIIFLLFIVLFLSISAVSAEGNFTALKEEIDLSTDSIEITQDYVYDNETDYELNRGIIINKSNFTINGNGYTIDASNQARIFLIYANNITISNLNIINCNKPEKIGGAIYSNGSLILNNITFTNNTAQMGGSIFSEKKVKIVNSTFNSSTSDYGVAIYAKNELTIINSTFKDLYALETAGAIAIKESENVWIENCRFINTRSFKNAGAISADINGQNYNFMAYVRIIDTIFENACSGFGGAFIQLGGNLFMNNSIFINNSASYNGAAIYISGIWNASIANTSIVGNRLISENNGFGGGIYSDNSIVAITQCEFINNTAQGIYAYDTELNVENTRFSNNGEAIHGVFLKYNITDTDMENDTTSLDNTEYMNIVCKTGLELALINNTIDVADFPSRYDSRDWGWVSPIKNQGRNGACAMFSTIASLESALLKSTGIEYDLSENNMQNTILQYSKYGLFVFTEGTLPENSLGYLLSWLGPIAEEEDSYDEVGKLSPLSTTQNIHIQDAILIEPSDNFTDTDAVKEAILKCGAVTSSYFSKEALINGETGAYYSNMTHEASHGISIIGWDDNYPKENFLITPPGNGAWICKNSHGSKSGENGFLYISYYEKTFFNKGHTIGIIIENTENYTKNYQTDLTGYLREIKNNVSYKNSYEAIGNELISAVGTYFNKGENYTLEIYVNDKLAHSQSGIAPFSGFHTVKLTSEIPITAGDIFTAVMDKPSVIMLTYERQYKENVTFINSGSGWEDLSQKKMTVSLKVYTKDLAVYAKDLVKIYKNASMFEANIGVANETVTFEVNGGTYNRTSDENGTARIAINLNPGEYTIKTSYNGTAVENKITVLPTLIGENLVKYFRNASQFFIDLIDGEGNPVTGVNITMNINGVFYNRVTNENGTARLNINLNPGEYILTAIDPLTGLQMSYIITVLPTLEASDLEMTYKDGSTFNVTVLDGEGNPLVNAIVTFNINGVFYNRTTDPSGIARLNINLMAGKYIITSEYDNLRISNTITIRD